MNRIPTDVKIFGAFETSFSFTLTYEQKYKKRIVIKPTVISGDNIDDSKYVSIIENKLSSYDYTKYFLCHVYMIPRRKGEVPNPRGGLRHVIPNRVNYRI